MNNYHAQTLIDGATHDTHVAVQIQRHALVCLAEAFLELHELRGRDLVQRSDAVLLLVGQVAVRVCARVTEVGVAVEAVVAGVHDVVARLADVAEPFAFQLHHRLTETVNQGTMEAG